MSAKSTKIEPHVRITNKMFKFFKRRMKDSEFDVYFALVMHSNKQAKSCYPTIKTLCEETGLSENTVIRAIKSLENKFYIVEVIRNRRDYSNRPTSNLYKLLDSEEAMWRIIKEESESQSSNENGIGNVEKTVENEMVMTSTVEVLNLNDCGLKPQPLRSITSTDEAINLNDCGVKPQPLRSITSTIEDKLESGNQSQVTRVNNQSQQPESGEQSHSFLGEPSTSSSASQSGALQKISSSNEIASEAIDHRVESETKVYHPLHRLKLGIEAALKKHTGREAVFGLMDWARSVRYIKKMLEEDGVTVEEFLEAYKLWAMPKIDFCKKREMPYQVSLFFFQGQAPYLIESVRLGKRYEKKIEDMEMWEREEYFRKGQEEFDRRQAEGEL